MKRLWLLTLATVGVVLLSGCNRGWPSCWNRGEPCEVYSQPSTMIDGIYGDYSPTIETTPLPTPIE